MKQPETLLACAVPQATSVKRPAFWANVGNMSACRYFVVKDWGCLLGCAVRHSLCGAAQTGKKHSCRLLSPPIL